MAFRAQIEQHKLRICESFERAPMFQSTSCKMDASAQRRVTLLITGSLVCYLIVCLIQPSDALFNCLTPNMFKMGGKMGQQNVYGAHPGERASWYQQPNQQQLYAAMAYGQHPMSRLFQPKWRSSLFGPKRWMDWRMGGAPNMNFYRPGQGYWPTTQTQVQPAPLNPAISGGGGGGGGGSLSNQGNYNNQYSDQLNLSPYTSNPSAQQLPSGISNPYGTSLEQPQTYNNNNNLNDGWSVPYNSPYNRPPAYQQPYGDSYTVMPGPNNNNQQSGKQQQQQQQYDPNTNFGTKGASGNKQQQQQFGTTKKYNQLMADAGFSAMDALYPPRNYSHTGFGYSYPEWYSGVVESPAKIAQQLYKIQQRRVSLGLKY